MSKDRLEIIRKFANHHMERYSAYAEELAVIIDYARNRECYSQGVTFREEKEKAIRAYEHLLSGGVSPLALYRADKLAKHIIECVDAYKKKLFVDKKKAIRAQGMLGDKERTKASANVDYDIKHVDKTLIGLAK